MSREASGSAVSVIGRLCPFVHLIQAIRKLIDSCPQTIHFGTNHEPCGFVIVPDLLKKRVSLLDSSFYLAGFASELSPPHACIHTDEASAKSCPQSRAH